MRRHGLLQILDHSTPEQLTDHQEQMLAGLMLGDGCLFRRKETHLPYLSILRATADRPYLEYNYACFKEFAKSGITERATLDKRTKKTYHACKFITRRSRAFVEYYMKWYPFGIKRVPHDIALTPLTMSIWFADDGHVRTSCSPWRLQMQLSTDGFDQHSVELLRHLLEIKCNAHFWLTKDGRIGAADSGTRAFATIIDQYLPFAMARKAIWRRC
jgi:hypothetical protein